VSDPVRLREGGSEVSSELSALFADAPKPAALPDAVNARMAAKIATLGPAPGAPLARMVPWVGGGALLLAGAITLVARGRNHTPQTPPNPPAPVVVPALPLPDPAAPVDTTTLPGSKPAPPSRSTPAEAASAPEDALAGEARLLQQAHDAMTSDPRKALAIAHEHAKRYPSGQLAAERELIMVQALMKLGRVHEAEARGRALRKSAPNSIYGDRLDAILHDR
jgi:hypothetical protein